MSLVINGVIVPEDTANALTLNGVDTTSMFVNGVQVFNQQLFSATWSGSSVVTAGTLYPQGITTSGSNYKYSGVINYGDPGSTAWGTADSNGLANQQFRLVANFFTAGFDTTPTTFSHYTNTVSTVGTVLFSIGSGFSGSSYSAIDSTVGYYTSGGAIRYGYGANNYGSFITLT